MKGTEKPTFDTPSVSNEENDPSGAKMHGESGAPHLPGKWHDGGALDPGDTKPQDSEPILPSVYLIFVLSSDFPTKISGMGKGFQSRKRAGNRGNIFWQNFVSGVS